MPMPLDPEAQQAYREKMSRVAKEKGFGKWMKGKTPSVETRKKISDAQLAYCTEEECLRRSVYAKAHGYGKWMQGRILPAYVVEKIVQHKRGCTYTEIYGDRAEQERLKRKLGNRRRFEGQTLKYEEDPNLRLSPEYREWRVAVFERDQYACQACGLTSTILNAHHIEPWAVNESRRYDVENGITLCVLCHKIVTFRWFTDNLLLLVLQE